jgi:hypothetical protein
MPPESQSGRAVQGPVGAGVCCEEVTGIVLCLEVCTGGL